jgi:stage III sporulation protein SpoIIIAA
MIVALRVKQKRNGLIACPPEDGKVTKFRNIVVVLCKELKIKDGI